MGRNYMKYFQATPEVFNSLRLQIIEQYSMPNNFAKEPWEKDVDLIALNQFESDEYNDLVEIALGMGAMEISESDYFLLKTQTTFQ